MDQYECPIGFRVKLPSIAAKLSHQSCTCWIIVEYKVEKINLRWKKLKYRWIYFMRQFRMFWRNQRMGPGWNPKPSPLWTSPPNCMALRQKILHGTWMHHWFKVFVWWEQHYMDPFKMLQLCPAYEAHWEVCESQTWAQKDTHTQISEQCVFFFPRLTLLSYITGLCLPTQRGTVTALWLTLRDTVWGTDRKWWGWEDSRGLPWGSSRLTIQNGLCDPETWCKRGASSL